MPDYLKHDEVLIDIYDQHEDLFIRNYVMVRVAYKLPAEAFENIDTLPSYVNTVVDAARDAAQRAYIQHRPEEAGQRGLA